MFWWRGLEYLKDRAIKISPAIRIPDIDIELQETVCAGIQTTGGIALAIYTFKNSRSRIWSFVSSAIAINGICTVFTTIRKTYWRSTDIEREKIWSAWHLANGIVIYMSNIFALSEALKLGDKLWILCFALAASGYYFVATSIRNLERDFSRKIYLKCCQKMFEPTLIGCATIYLLYFRNHEEEWLYWFPFAVIAATGFKSAYFGFYRAENIEDPKSLILKWIEIVTGGCLLIGSGTVLTIYFTVKDFHSFWLALMFCSIIYGLYAIYDSLDLLYNFYPRPEFHKTCLQVLGPVMIVYSSLIAACVGYCMGWRFSQPAICFVPVGIYSTYRGFRREDQPT